MEYFAKNNNRQNFCISCTSTLELGIDIGTVDEVVQIDATHSISSLIQRVGRSGRKEGESSNLFLYATNEWSLLQSISCWLLYKEGFIEPPQKNEKPYDILVHQVLSITKGHSGIVLSELTKQISENSAFCQIAVPEIEQVINHLISIDFLEKIQCEVIIGVEGEKIVNSRDFYSVFKTEENFKVINAGNTIGEIPYSPQIIEDENILLSARIWKIKFVDQKAKKIDVVPTKDGRKPMFFGGGGAIHQKIREKMLEILYSNSEYDFLDLPSSQEIEKLRKEFSTFNVRELLIDRPLLSSEKHLQFFTFTGTRINRTIHFLLNIAGMPSSLDDRNSSFEIQISNQELRSKFYSLKHSFADIDNHIAKLLQSSPALLDFSKWGIHLPEIFQVKLIKDKYFDIEGTEQLLSAIRLIDNK